MAPWVIAIAVPAEAGFATATCLRIGWARSIHTALLVFGWLVMVR
jgi:hypothetical protein